MTNVSSKLGQGPTRPFGKVIYCHENLLVFITGWRMASHEVYAPFVEGVVGDDWIEKSWWPSCLVFIEMVFSTSLDIVYVVMKQREL
jgi:hypothetical protein